jgi:hypothetical protein
MEMKKISSGKLRAISYDATTRRLRVQMDDGTVLEYSGIGQEIWRRLSTSASPWSVYRDNVEEEFTASRATTADFQATQKKNPLDDLFG